MSVSFSGIGELAVTFKTDGAVTAGSPVKMKSNGTVTACAAGDKFCGAALAVSDDNHATIQIGGYTVCTYDGTAPTVGFGIIAAAGDGKIKTAEDGRECLIVDVDETQKTVGFYM